MASGGIFNPFGRNHGSPDDEERMVGDLGKSVELAVVVFVFSHFSCNLKSSF